MNVKQAVWEQRILKHPEGERIKNQTGQKLYKGKAESQEMVVMSQVLKS